MIIGVLLTISIILAIGAFVDVLTVHMPSIERVCWMIVIVLVPLAGPLCHFVMNRHTPIPA